MLDPNTVLIATQQLTKVYDNEGVKTVALEGASITIARGEFVSIMGPSGSGKSTLMQILGLLDRPTSGRYLLEGVDVTTLSDDALAELRNKKIGFVFQSFNLLPKTSVFENVELPLLYDSVVLENNDAKVRSALEAVDMLHRIEYLSNQLSGEGK